VDMKILSPNKGRVTALSRHAPFTSEFVKACTVDKGILKQPGRSASGR